MYNVQCWSEGEQQHEVHPLRIKSEGIRWELCTSRRSHKKPRRRVVTQSKLATWANCKLNWRPVQSFKFVGLSEGINYILLIFQRVTCTLTFLFNNCVFTQPHGTTAEADLSTCLLTLILLPSSFCEHSNSWSDRIWPIFSILKSKKLLKEINPLPNQFIWSHGSRNSAWLQRIILFSQKSGSVWILLIFLFSRPKKMDEVAHQQEVVETLKKSIETGNVNPFFFFFLITLIKCSKYMFFT